MRVMKGNINGAQTHVQSKVWKNWNRSMTNLKHSKYQTLITNQLYSYIIVFHHFQVIQFLYWENIFFLKCWCSSWLGGREGAYKEMRITAYEHNQLLFSLIRRALYSLFMDKLFQFQKIILIWDLKPPVGTVDHLLWLSGTSSKEVDGLEILP